MATPDWRRTAALSLLVGAGLALGQALLVSVVDALLPDARLIGSFNRPGTLTILSADGEVIQKIGPATREKLTLESLPSLVEQAFIAAEDRRFYQHGGIDLIGIGRAVMRNLSQRSVEEGASTITQQLARTVFLSQDVTLIRKLKEAAVASKLERQLSKRQILSEYLNVVYLGSSAYGVADAAWIYFSKTPSQLTLPEAALVAGLPPAPSVYSPLVNPDLALQRRSIVLARMEEAGFIDAEQRAEAEATPLQLKPAEPKYWESQAPWFSTWVQQELPSVLSKEQLEVGGLTVRSTLNLSWQQQGQATINRFASGQMEGALVAMDPGSGSVRAMVGGKDFRKSQFNRAALALRSPGSTFKLFVYLSALKGGMRPERSVVDTPSCFAGYCPGNFGGRYLGRVSLAVALQNSLNTVAVSLLKELGFERVIATARSLGITREIGRFYPMAIGAYEQTLLDMTAAYAAITNRGIYVKPTPFETILGPDGQLLWSRKTDGDRGRRAVDSTIADTMQWMLQQVVKGGTGSGAALPKRPVAGKTGTSEGGRDLWFIGSIPQLTTGVWLGYDDSRETGSTSVVATLAWRDFMAPISKSLPVRQFPPKPQLQNTDQPATRKPRPATAGSGAAPALQAPVAPLLPERFAAVPEGTPTNARPNGPGANAAPGALPPIPAPPRTVTAPPPPIAAPPAP